MISTRVCFKKTEPGPNRFVRQVNVITGRNVEILKALAEGKTAKMIGKDLNMSPRTVEKYINDMRLITSCVNIPNLVAEAIRGGIIE